MPNAIRRRPSICRPLSRVLADGPTAGDCASTREIRPDRSARSFEFKGVPLGLLVCLFYRLGPRRWLGYDEVIEGSSGYRGHLPKRKFLIASAAGREGMEPFLVTRYYYCLLINVARARCDGASFGFSSVGVCENVVS